MMMTSKRPPPASTSLVSLEGFSWKYAQSIPASAVNGIEGLSEHCYYPPYTLIIC